MAGAAENMVKTVEFHTAPVRPYYKRDEKYNDLDAPTSNGFDNGVYRIYTSKWRYLATYFFLRDPPHFSIKLWNMIIHPESDWNN